jgi:hypothetical protein
MGKCAERPHRARRRQRLTSSKTVAKRRAVESSGRRSKSWWNSSQLNEIAASGNLHSDPNRRHLGGVVRQPPGCMLGTYVCCAELTRSGPRPGTVHRYRGPLR